MTTDASIAVPFVGDSTARAVDNALIQRQDLSFVYRQRVECHTDAPITSYAHPIEYEVRHAGTLNGMPAKMYHIMGSRSLGWNSTTILGDACDYLNTTQSLMNTPTTGQTLYLVSTSANDAAAGTGARTVRTVYLDANGLQQVRTDTLNGTTPVNIGSGYSFIQWMEVASTGSSEVAVGALSISSTNGAATVATTFEKVGPGGNRSLSGRYKVPSDCHAHLVHWDAGAISNTMDVRIRATVFADDGTLSTVYHSSTGLSLGPVRIRAHRLNTEICLRGAWSRFPRYLAQRQPATNWIARSQSSA